MVKVCLLLCFLVVVAFGFVHGSIATEEVGVYELQKGNFSVKLTNWGATIISVVLPDKDGKLADVVLGNDSVEAYKNDSRYFGAIVGRVANRIGGAQFSLDGTHYMAANEGNNVLHVGSSIDKLPHGYDLNYVLDGVAGKKLKPAAVVQDKKTGRMMELWTTAPGVQFYTANYVMNVTGKDGFVYQPHAALCLETQAFPDSVNHPNFPSTIVTPGHTYKHNMLFKFSITSPSC